MNEEQLALIISIATVSIFFFATYIFIGKLVFLLFPLYVILVYAIYGIINTFNILMW